MHRGRNQLLPDGAVKRVTPASFTSSNFTTELHSSCSVAGTLFFSCKFPCQNYNGHLIKGQPSFIFLFSKETSISSLAFGSVWASVTWQRNYWCISSCSSFKFFHLPPFSSFKPGECFTLNMFSLFNGILKLAVEGIFACLPRLSCW